MQLFNIWVPVAAAERQPLLMCAAGRSGSGPEAWEAASDGTHHLPAESARAGDWFFFGGLRNGEEALVLPGDGGAAGVFHGSAAAPAGEAQAAARASFDVREFVVAAPPDGAPEGAATRATAEARLSADRARS